MTLMEFQLEAEKTVHKDAKTQFNPRATKWKYKCWVPNNTEYTIHTGRTPIEALENARKGD